MRLVKGSMGSFMDPPGSPQREWEVLEGPTDDPHTMMSLKGALAEDWVSDHMKKRIRKLFDEAHIECTEEWQREVYSYFRNCYSPDGIDRSVSNCIIDRENPDSQPIEHHLGFLYVRQWFPEHTPRTDLIKPRPESEDT